MKILVIRLSSLGDIVLTEPVIRTLRERYGKTKQIIQIDYLTKDKYRDIVACFDIDNIYGWNNKLITIKQLREQKYDIVIDLQSKFNTWLIKLFLAVPKTVTYNKKHLQRLLITKKLLKKPFGSTVELYFTALQKLGIRAEASKPKLVLHSQRCLLPQSKKLKLGIFPGALHTTKQYPIEQLASFIDMLPDEKELEIYIFGSSEEKPLANQLSELTSRKFHDYTGKLKLAELLVAMDQLQMIISNDSGPMHIAAALQKPQIAIFGATHPILGFAPRNEKAKVLCLDLACQPCSLHGSSHCPLQHFRCMKDITSQKLFTAYVKLSKQYCE